MAKGILGSLPGDWPKVVSAVNSVFGGEEFILLSEDGDAKRLHFRRATSLGEKDMPRGRAFDKQVEVRWRKVSESRFIISYLSEAKQPPAGFEICDVRFETTRCVQKLYGKWSSGTQDWVEVAVSGVSELFKNLFEPNSAQHSFMLEVIDYSHNGYVQMTRFSNVVAYERR
jgi:hypothetical protein